MMIKVYLCSTKNRQLFILKSIFQREMNIVVVSVPDIEISEDEHSVSHLLESRLSASLKNSLPQGDNTSFILSARNPTGRIIGGLSASTSYGWLLVKLLWVDDDYRGKGVGRSLMRKAESKGIKLSCHSAWLDTSNPEAMDFYSKLGYETFGLLVNSEDQKPENHNRWFMKRSLMQ